MPRIKPPRSQQEEAEPVIVTAEPTPTDSVVIEIDDMDISVPTTVDLDATTTVKPYIEEPKPEPKVEPKVDDDAVRRAAEAAQRAEEYQRQLHAAQRQLAEQHEQITRERAERADSEYTTVLTAIAEAQTTLEKAESDAAAFAAAGDWSNFAKAQRAMASATARLDRFEVEKRNFDTLREQKSAPERPVQQPSQIAITTDQKIDALRIPPEGKSYLRQHPELVSDPSKYERLGHAHLYLTKNRGITEFSQEYFDALDQDFGFKAAPAAAASQSPPKRSIPVSAPVSREVPSASGSRVSNQVTLTPAEREIARNSFGPIQDKNGNWVDMTPAEKERAYAINKAKLQRLRASGEYRQTTEQTG